jgi:TonB family protein
MGRFTSVGLGLALAGLCLAGCATRPDDDLGPARLAVDGLVGRRCAYVFTGTAPSFGDLARVGTRGTVDLWGHGMSEADSAVVSVRYGEDGALEWVRAMKATVDPDRTASLEAILLSAVDETGPPDWGVRLVVVAGEVVDVLPSVLCEAERVAGGVPVRPMGTRAEMAELARALGRRFSVAVTLDEDGRVIGARMLQRSGSEILDQAVLHMAWDSRFAPKLHDGMGVVTELAIDIHYRRY